MSTLLEDLRSLQGGKAHIPTQAELSELRWETRQAIFLNLLSEIPGCDAGAILSELVHKRRQGRRDEKARERSGRAEDIGMLPEQTRKEEDAFRTAFMETVANEMKGLSAPRGLCNSKLLMRDKTQCLSAISFLVHKQKSRAKAHSGMMQRLASPAAAAAPPLHLPSAGFPSPSSGRGRGTDYQTAGPRLLRPNGAAAASAVAGKKRSLIAAASSLKKASGTIKIEDRPAWVSPLGNRDDYDLNGGASYDDRITSHGSSDRGWEDEGGDGSTIAAKDFGNSSSFDAPTLANSSFPKHSKHSEPHDDEAEDEEARSSLPSPSKSSVSRVFRSSPSSSPSQHLPSAVTGGRNEEYGSSTASTVIATKGFRSASTVSGGSENARIQPAEYNAGAGTIEISCIYPSRRSSNAATNFTTSSIGMKSTISKSLGPSSSTKATAFYCNQLSTLEEEIMQLRRENGSLKDQVSKSQSLYEALAVKGSSSLSSVASNIDERWMFMLQSQNLQLQRQVRVLTEALNGSEDLSNHLAALLSTLEGNVQEIVRIGKEGVVVKEEDLGSTGRRPPPASSTTCLVSKSTSKPPLKVGAEFWKSVLEEIRHLNQKRIEIFRVCRARHVSRIVLPNDAKIFLKKPRELATAEKLSGEIEDRAALKQVGAVASETVLSGLKAERLQKLSESLHRILSDLHDLGEVLLNDPVLLAHRASAEDHSDVEEVIRSTIDQTRALLLDAGNLGLVMPATASRCDDGKEKEMLEIFETIRQPGMKPSEISHQASLLQNLVLGERRALAKSLSRAMEEVVIWRTKGSRHRTLIQRLSEGLEDLYRCQEEETANAVEALGDLLTSLDMIENHDEAPRVIRGQVGPGLARLVQGLLEYRGELERLYDVSGGGGGGGGGARSGNRKAISSSHATQVKAKLNKLWSQYRALWQKEQEEEEEEEVRARRKGAEGGEGRCNDIGKSPHYEDFRF